MSLPLLGYSFSLTSAFLWAVATILYKDIGRQVSPLGMNIGKSLVAALLMGIVLLFNGFETTDPRTLFFLIISGALGISLGDTLFFRSLQYLKPSLAMLTTTLIPVLTILFAILILRELPSVRSWGGILLTLTGIMIVLSKERRHDPTPGISWRGLLCGLLSALFCSASIIITKIALTQAAPLEASFIRNLSGGGLLLGVSIFSDQRRTWFKPFLNDPRTVQKLLWTAFIGAFLGTWCSLLGLKFAAASIATVLNSTSPILILPLSYLMLKENFSKTALCGSIIAVVGVCLIFTGGPQSG